MATALQCPACGFKHRLDAVVDTPVFPCSKCSRQLKLPSQYRNGATARPGSAPSAANGAGARPPGAGAAGVRGRSPRSLRAAGGQVRIPLRILAWVVAFVLGALVVRMVAKWTGFVDSNTFVDLMLDHSFSTYSRLLVLVPVWALFATVFATVFIEAPDWWARRNSSSAASAVVPRRRIPAAAAASVVASESREPRIREPRTSETRPAADQRPRRIPRRETGS